jgi:DNA topoisomerase-3
MKLVIAEKPSVARAIYPVLGANTKKNGYTEGNGYIVSWCFGHLVGLLYPNEYCDKWAAKPWSFSMLPMIPDEWKFKVSADCEEQFGILKNLLNDSRVDEVVCATDADREGECIFRYVYNLSGSRKPVKRLWVSSLEETAIKDGFEHLKDGGEYDNLYNAGFCRAKADWLVGMNGSRLFSVRYNSALSTGRVQTPTLAMIVKRDYDVKNFVKQKFFTVELDCGSFKATSERIDDETNANSLVSACNGKTAAVTEVKKEVKTVNPPKLYDLTTLQREANKVYGYTAQQTLDYMQALYEGKLVTYPRTDSQYITDDMEQTARDMVTCVYETFPDFGTLAAEPDIKRLINNKKVTGHHAIIPTEKIKTADLSALPSGQKNILMLVSARLICATSLSHKFESVKVSLSCENTPFTASGKTVLENGWKSVEEKTKNALASKNTDDDEEKDDTKTLPEITQGMTFENVSAEKCEHFTSPPKPYTEDTLLSAMEHAGAENFDENSEKKGLGTPATRAATIEGLVKHGYAERKGKKITATEKGVNLINVVPEEVKSPKLTADWEMQLQQIERGEHSADSFMGDITAFVQDICTKYGAVDSSVNFNGSKSEAIGKCPKCGGDIVKGKFGFYCKGKCGMNVAKVYGKELTEAQITKLLSGKEISYTANGKKTIVIPEVGQNDYNGKTYYNWKTKKG